MNQYKVNPGDPDPEVIQRAVSVLRNEGVIIHPTETVYGLACFYSSEKALRRTLDIKGRHLKQPFSIMIRTLDDIFRISGCRKKGIETFIGSILPGPVTVLFPRKIITGTVFWDQFPLLGFRLPKHRLSNLLVEESGSPLITTSANFSGKVPHTNVDNIPEKLAAKVDLVLDGGNTTEKIPSTVISIDEGYENITLVRAGAMSWETIQDLFNKK